MTDRRVVVTGGSGFIGRPAIAALRARGLEPHLLGRSPVGDAPFTEVDLLDRAAAAEAIRALAAPRLLHLAWTAEPGRFWTSPDNLDWVAASLGLLRAFAEAGGRRAVMAGTCAEYDWTAGGRLDEALSPCAPATLYGIAKDALFRVAAAYARGAGVSLAWGRVFFLYGPQEKRGRLMGDAVDALRAGRPFPSTAGRQRRDFLHVEDVAGAFAALVDSGAEGAVNIGSGTAVAVADILGEIARQCGAADLLRLGALPDRPDDPPLIEAADARLRAAGFVPRIALAEGVADMLRRRPLPDPSP